MKEKDKEEKPTTRKKLELAIELVQIDIAMAEWDHTGLFTKKKTDTGAHKEMVTRENISKPKVVFWNTNSINNLFNLTDVEIEEKLAVLYCV